MVVLAEGRQTVCLSFVGMDAIFCQVQCAKAWIIDCISESN